MSSTEPPYWSILQHTGHETSQNQRTEGAREEVSTPVIDQGIAEAKAAKAAQAADNA